MTTEQVQQMIDDALQTQAAASPAQLDPGAAPALFQPPSWNIDFKNGILFKTTDDMFSLRINDLTQFDYRNFSQTAMNSHTNSSLQDNFSISRQWLYFRGNASEYLDYQVVLASGTGTNTAGAPATVNLLDAYLDFNLFGSEYKELFQIRVGRFKTPYLYQFYKLSPQDFVTPELSMFGTNFLQNRQDGAMAHGYLADKRIDYAAGIFNGQPNTFEVAQNSRQGIYYLGLAPFLLEEGSVLKNLNLIVSGAAGQQFGAAIPATLSTAVPSGGPPNNANISPTFLSFAPSGGVGGASASTIHRGEKALADFELIWAYKSLNLYGEYNLGYQTYAIQTAAGKLVPKTTAEVRVSGFSVATTYFLTGEQISTGRSRVQPLREYGNGGIGALEAFSRYSNLALSNNVFTDHIANSAIFANVVGATDTGVNWYFNPYIKVTFEWQHAMFNNPISLTGAAGGNLTKTQDILSGAASSSIINGRRRSCR